MRLSLIVASDLAGGIGVRGTLPWRLPRDLQDFKKRTWAHPVIMGWNTFESLSQRTLQGRLNIVLSSQHSALPTPFLSVKKRVEEAIKKAETWQTKEVFVIGGAQIYSLFLPRAQRIYRTLVETKNIETDTFFPAWDAQEWTLTSSEKHTADTQHAHAFCFEIWDKKN